jgi:hypothetical protein
MVLIINKTNKQITSLGGFQICFQICFSCEFYGDSIKKNKWFWLVWEQ